jgi:glycerophosphoryl diester phosphodiesterase
MTAEACSSSSKNRLLALLRASGRAPAILAHRGDSFHAPENTLEAARAAWQAGAAAWELDVQLTRDGVPIVIHDESLLRTTDVARRFAGDPRGIDGFRVSDFDFDEVRALDAGSWFVATDGGPRAARAFGTLDRLDAAARALYASGAVRIPTLAEALAFTREQDWLINVEIKSFPDRPSGLVERVLQEIADSGTASRVLISSFDHADIATANRTCREYALGILTATPLHRVHEYAAQIVGADTIHVSAPVLGAKSIAYRRSPAARSLVDLSHLRNSGMPVLVFTVNNHGPGSLAAHLAEIGVNGLFTDDPRGMKRSFEP